MATKPYPYANAAKAGVWTASEIFTGAISLTGAAPRGVAIQFTDVTDWQAADVTFQVSDNGTTWYTVRDGEASTAGTPVVVKVGAAAVGVYTAPAGAWVIGAFDYVRLVTVSTADPSTGVEQTVAVPFNLVLLQ